MSKEKSWNPPDAIFKIYIYIFQEQFRALFLFLVINEKEEQKDIYCWRKGKSWNPPDVTSSSLEQMYRHAPYPTVFESQNSWILISRQLLISNLRSNDI